MEAGLLRFIACGSVDDGKSTLIGRLLYDAKTLYADQKQRLVLDSQVGSRGGEIDYSLLLDGLAAEREQGITIDVAHLFFSTESRSFIVADTPGHEQYTRNMAVGASTADLAAILVDARKGVTTQTKRHARICAMMGVRLFIFAVNKMDLVGYSAESFQEAMKGVEALCREAGLEGCSAIPVSATEGDNVASPSLRMPWYQGPCLLKALEEADASPGREEEGFCMPVQRVSRPDWTFRGFQGQVESGQVAVGEAVTALPGGETALVKSIHVSGKAANAAYRGQPASIQLDREVDISRGSVLSRGSGVFAAKSFCGAFLWMDEEPLVEGKGYWAKIAAKASPAVVSSVLYKIDVATGARASAEKIEKNDIFFCEIALSEQAVLSEFRRHKALGEAILIDRLTNQTAACGTIESVGPMGGGKTAFSEGGKTLEVGLFDAFFYHPAFHEVMRRSPPPRTYALGEELPLEGEGVFYPRDFDVGSGGLIARVRRGAFAGFGERDRAYPLLDENGIELETEKPRRFGRYRSVGVWEDDYEI